jgi:hypothetical protein
MTDSPHDDLPELQHLDATARAAASGLRRHVDQHVDVDLALASAPAISPPRARHRVMALAAVAALLVGSVALLDAGGDDDRDRLQVDEDGNRLPDPQPGALTPLGPRDGKDSIRLPVTVEPNRDVADGTTVTVSGEGFVPGERVGIVQCASEAGGDTPEARGGVDGCNVGGVQYADADANGVATGTIVVRRVLTTPLTGTVDCSIEADRCIVAMGALNDYDRSGGFGIEVRGGGEPIAIPEVTVSPAEGLADGDVVTVSGVGLVPGDQIGFSVCSSDPVSCWDTTPAGEEWGTTVAPDGTFTAQVPVWRYLPGAAEQPGTYVDCAVSPCSLRLSGESTPPPVRLAFLPGGEGPRAPALAVEPADGLAPGDEVVARGAGFAPGWYVNLSLCSAPVDEPTLHSMCIPFDTGQPPRVGDDGRFAVEARVPDPAAWSEGMTEQCDSGGRCIAVEAEPSGTPFCDAVATRCTIHVDTWSETESFGLRPTFPPVPVPVTFR